MNTDAPIPPPAELEARITALLLGELSPEETEDLRRTLAQDPALAALHDRLAQAIHVLRQAAGSPDGAAVWTAAAATFPAEKRRRLVRQLQAPPFSEPQAASRKEYPWYLPLSLAAVLLALLAVAALVLDPGNFLRARTTAMKAVPAKSALRQAIAFDPSEWKGPPPANTPRRGEIAGYAVAGKSSARKRVLDEKVREVEPPLAPPPLAVGEALGAPEEVVASNVKALVTEAAPGAAGASKDRREVRGYPVKTKGVPVLGATPTLGRLFSADSAEAKPPQSASAGKPEGVDTDSFGAFERFAADWPRGGRTNALQGGGGAGGGGFGGVTAGKVEIVPRLRFGVPVEAPPVAVPAPAPASAPPPPPTPQLAASKQPAAVPAAPAALPQVAVRVEAEQLAKAKALAVPAQQAAAERAAGIIASRGGASVGRLTAGQEALSEAVSSLGVLELDKSEAKAAAVEAGTELAVTLADADVAGRSAAPETRLLRRLAPTDLEDRAALAPAPVAAPEPQPEAPTDLEGRAALAPAPVAAPEPQPEVQTAENPFSTFSLNVTDVSLKLAAASLEKGGLPAPATVRSEEFLNAFDYRDPEPPAGMPIGLTWERARYPFAHNREVIRLAVRTAAVGRERGRPLNLVLLLDNSGSMERADRVAIRREALRVLAQQLTATDKLSVIAFARTARLCLDGLSGAQADEALQQLADLTPQGGTNLEDALGLAYRTAARHYVNQGINRVVLMTDGAANLGNVDPAALGRKVESNRQQGIALDCFGIGWEGYNDDLLEVLARHGDGRYAFLNAPEEVATEFAAQLAGALRVAAADLKVQVEFNPRRVTAYRQMGYAKHQLTKEQFRDNTVDAAELGAAETGNALYLLEVDSRGQGDLGVVRVRYRTPATGEYHEHEWPIPSAGGAPSLDRSTPALRLAVSATAFAEWLAGSPLAAEVTTDRLLELLRGVPAAYELDPRPQRLEAMVRQAKAISGR